jgi:hypothetical protein
MITTGRLSTMLTICIETAPRVEQVVLFNMPLIYRLVRALLHLISKNKRLGKIAVDLPYEGRLFIDDRTSDQTC